MGVGKFFPGLFSRIIIAHQAIRFPVGVLRLSKRRIPAQDAIR
jgi:hypothetical protein